MKICIIAAGYPPDVKGGGEISTEVLAQCLVAADNQVDVVCCGLRTSKRVEDGVFISQIRSPNIFWNFRGGQSSTGKIVWHLLENFNPRAFYRLKRLLIDLKPDVLITSTIENFGAEAWRVASTLNIKTVHVLRSYYPLCWRGSMFARGRNCNRVCNSCLLASIGRRRASKYVDGVIGLCKYTLEAHLVAGLFERAKTALIPDPISVDDNICRPKKTYQGGTFGYLGVLTENKGLGNLALAYQKLKVKPKLLIAGTGDTAYVGKLSSQLDFPEVSFIGWVDRREFFAKVDFLVAPSIWNEPFGRIVMEAFVEGVPVLGSDRGGIGEMITDGRNGFLFSSNSVEELVLTWQKACALDDPAYNAMSARAVEDSKASHGKSVAERYVKFIESLT